MSEPSRPRPPHCGGENVIDDLICKATRAHAFADEGNHYFSSYSAADIFEVDAEGGGTVRSNVRDGELREAIQTDAPTVRKDVRTRVIFIEGWEQDPERLPIESAVLEQVFDTYDITPRFADFLTRQHMPGRAVHHVPGTRDLARHEIWYSAVIRTHSDYRGTHFDRSRLVVNWQRMCVWSSYTPSTSTASDARGTATFLLLRCPPHIRQKFYDAFAGPAGLSLRRHPMLLHAFLAEHLVMHAYDFLQFFSDPLYAWEGKVSTLQTTEDYTERSKAFLALSRQIHQVATDYDILAETIAHLARQCAWFNEWLIEGVRDGEDVDGGKRLLEMRDAQRVLGDAFENLTKDVKLIGTYSGLYLERSKIGVSECFAMVTQRDAETNISISTESATIARASHQDASSLRIIQILSMIFLPASLISSIFGMGFFNTQPRDDGSAQFTVSPNWWWYIAIAIPVTLALWLYMVAYRYYSRQRIDKIYKEEEKRRGGGQSGDGGDVELGLGKKES